MVKASPEFGRLGYQTYGIRMYFIKGLSKNQTCLDFGHLILGTTNWEILS